MYDGLLSGADPGLVVRGGGGGGGGGAWVGEVSGDRFPAGPMQSPGIIWTTILNQPRHFYEIKKNLTLSLNFVG